jgi:segregation and condensation protein B
MNLKAVLEGLLFLAGSDGLTFEQIKTILEINDEKAKEIIGKLNDDYKFTSRGLKLELLGGAFKLTTKREHQKYFEKMTESDNEALSTASLETLAIIAYNQPITRGDIEELRGVSSSHIVRRLLIKNLIQDCGKAKLPGKPTLYSTTAHFLDYFGLSSLDELPPLAVKEESKEKNLFETKYEED